jgi:hypothetical protein
LALVSPSFIYIGVPAESAPGPAISEGYIVSNLHIVQAEPLGFAAPPA